MDTNKIILLLMALLAVGGVVSFIGPFLQSRKRSGRIASTVKKRRGELGRQQMDAFARGQQMRQKREKPHVQLMNEIVKRFKLDEILSGRNVKMFLLRAGIRSKQAVMIYALSRVGGAIAGTVGAMVVLGMMQKEYTYLVTVGIWIGGGVVGFFLPKLMIQNAAAKRQHEITRSFPDAMDLMVICVEAGLSIEGAFDRVTQEIAETSPILAQEMGLATAELAFLGDRSKAYQNFAERTGVPAVKSLATALIQSERYGTSVSTAVKVLATEKRQERMSVAEKKAASLPAKLTVPMIVFFLPVLFIVVIGPSIIQITKM